MAHRIQGVGHMLDSVDLAHGAGADQADDLLRADSCASGETHFFAAANQFTTTVRGVSTVSLPVVFTSKRLPSAATA